MESEYILSKKTLPLLKKKKKNTYFDSADYFMEQ
jgi:hypothetical protein